MFSLFIVESKSKLTLLGSSNVHDYSITTNKLVAKVGDISVDDGAVHVSNLQVSFPVLDFDSSGGLVMNMNIRRELQSDKYPAIVFDLPSATFTVVATSSSTPSTSTATTTSQQERTFQNPKVDGDVTVCGCKSKVQLTNTRIRVLANGNFNITG